MAKIVLIDFLNDTVMEKEGNDSITLTMLLVSVVLV
jgi:hypothetical protein